MSKTPLIDQLKEFVEEQTKDISTVSNLKGIVKGPSFVPKTPKAQRWTVAEVTAPSAVDNNSIFSAFTYENPGAIPMDSVLGFLSYPESGGSISEGKAILIYGTARIRNKSVLDLVARGEAYTISVYIRDVQVATGPSEADLSIDLSVGDHPIVIIFHGGKQPVTVQTSPDIEIVRADSTPKPPIWVRRPEPMNITGDLISNQIFMSWDNGSHAASWNIYRSMAEIVGYTSNDVVPTRDPDDGSVTVTILSSSAQFKVGDHLYTTAFEMGDVLAIDQLDSSVILRVRPSLDSNPSLSEWVGLTTCRLTPFHALTSVPNAGNLTVEFTDTNVRPLQMYLYKITAVSAIGNIESDYSTIGWVFNFDDIPPSPINWNPDYPPIITNSGGTVTVRFLTPPEADFQGVLVYGPFPVDGDGDPIGPGEVFSTGSILTSIVAPPNTQTSVSFSGSDGSAYFIASTDVYGNIEPGIPIVSPTGIFVPAAYSFVLSATDNPDPEILVLTVFSGPLYFTVAYVAIGIVTYSINGNPYSTPPGVLFNIYTTPFSQTVIFKATSNGKSVTQTIFIPAAALSIATPVVDYSDSLGQLAASFTFSSYTYNYFVVHPDGGDLAPGQTTWTPSPYSPNPAGTFARSTSVYVTAHDAAGAQIAISPTTTFNFQSDT